MKQEAKHYTELYFMKDIQESRDQIQSNTASQLFKLLSNDKISNFVNFVMVFLCGDYLHVQNSIIMKRATLMASKLGVDISISSVTARPNPIDFSHITLGNIDLLIPVSNSGHF